MERPAPLHHEVDAPIALPPQNAQAASSVKPRPAWLRALGRQDPPAAFESDGRRWQRLKIYKHDAFAATALYAEVDRPEHRVIGKFARRQSAFGVPMAWLGRWFHGREQRVFARMADQPGVPRVLGPIHVNGKPWPCAAARTYVPGQPLEEGDRPDDAFFPQLEGLIKAFHARRVAVVDLHKRDNILIGDDGRPYLMDFQISLAPSLRFGGLDPRAWLLASSQRADLYHFMKHWIRHRPDQLSEAQRDLDRYRPWGVRVWRRFIKPIHVARRKLLVGLRVRTGRGDAETEVAPEVRPPTPGSRGTAPGNHNAAPESAPATSVTPQRDLGHDRSPSPATAQPEDSAVVATAPPTRKLPA